MKLLSVIIPVYNTADFLRECVGSVPMRDGVEVIIVDDGSDDGASPELCDEIARERSDVHVIHSENRGLGGARELGLAHADGEYVLFLDSDDLLADGAIAAIISAAEQHSRPDVISFGFLIRPADGTDIPYRDSICVTNGTFTARERPECLISLPSAWSRAWKRTFLQSSGIAFPSRLRYEDLATVPALLAAAGQVCTIGSALYVYRSRAGSIMTATDTTQNRDVMTAFDLLLSRFDSLGLTDAFSDELEHLAVTHVLLAATVRVLSRKDEASLGLARELIAYVKARFPHVGREAYLNRLNIRQKILFRLLSHGHVRAARILVIAHKALN